MPEPLLSDAELVKRLAAHPDLRSRIESLVLAVEDETGELKTADAAEMRIIEMMRRTGHDALQSWAQQQVDKTSQEFMQRADVCRAGKKTLLAHHLWRHQHRGAPIPSGHQSNPSVCQKRPSQQSWLFAAAAARSHRLWC